MANVSFGDVVVVFDNLFDAARGDNVRGTTDEQVRRVFGCCWRADSAPCSARALRITINLVFASFFPSIDENDEEESEDRLWKFDWKSWISQRGAPTTAAGLSSLLVILRGIIAEQV